MSDISFDLTGAALWQRMDAAVERIQQRLERTSQALQNEGIPFAIIGGNAVRAWVAQADEAAVRTTRDVDILIRRSDFEKSIKAMQAAGFVYRNVKSIDLFLDGPEAKPRDAVHVIFAGEKLRPEDIVAAPGIDETLQIQDYPTLTLEALVRMKLNAYRDKDRMHLRDMIEVELINASWLTRFPDALAIRLKELLDNPED